MSEDGGTPSGSNGHHVLPRFPMFNINDAHDSSLSTGQRVADAVARQVGSWRFIIIQSLLLAFWISANLLLAATQVAGHGFNIRAWDPAPFILLNLFLSFQAAYATPIIMMSQNRQADKDRLAAEHDYQVNIRSEATIRAALDHLKAQDDVIIAILRQLEKASDIQPDEMQLKAEESLKSCRDYEEETLWRRVEAEQREAGLDPVAAGSPEGPTPAV